MLNETKLSSGNKPVLVSDNVPQIAKQGSTKTVATRSISLQNDANLIRSINRIDRKLSLWNYALRGFIQGIFYVLGATIGITIIFFALGEILKGMNDIPIINSIIEKSRIVEIVQNELEQYEQKN